MAPRPPAGPASPSRRTRGAQALSRRVHYGKFVAESKYIADVVAALNGRFTDAQVREAVESLVNDGHLYSTIDDAHFRSTLL